MHKRLAARLGFRGDQYRNLRKGHIEGAHGRLGPLAHQGAQAVRRAGAFDEADHSLKMAIALNSADAKARAEAYLTLAKNAQAKGDGRSARAYATVVTSLFSDPALLAEAQKILSRHAEDDE